MRQPAPHFAAKLPSPEASTTAVPTCTVRVWYVPVSSRMTEVILPFSTASSRA
jgi:hypothetical protein